MVRLRSARGFTLIDLMAVMAVIAIVSAIAIPTMTNALEYTKLSQSAREVERELQIAKSRAVGKGRPIRIRFNCPGAGLYRITELVGVPSAPAAPDTAVDRCAEAVYPFPPDTDPLTLPNLDGPVRRLGGLVSFGQVQTIEFWPDGTAHYDTGGLPWQMIPVAGVSLTLTHKDSVSTITVNGLGKIRLETD